MAEQKGRTFFIVQLAMAELGLEHWEGAADLREVLEIYANLRSGDIGKSITDLTDASSGLGASRS